MGFEPFPDSRDRLLSLNAHVSMFALLHGPRGRSSSEASRILFTNSEGLATMYDADSRSVISVPPTGTGYTEGMAMPIVTGAGEEERLYVVRSGGSLNVLEFSTDSGWKRNLRWQALPPLPVDADHVSSFTTVDGGRIICVSVNWSTFCFDTMSQKWRHAGHWALPFEGRVEHVPELQTWVGFSDRHPHHLCAADLSGVVQAPRQQAPMLQHVWEDYVPPPGEETSVVLNKDYPGIVLTTAADWWVSQLFLVNLGSGRFCVAKVVRGEKSVSLRCSCDSHQELLGTLTVLTGVEVIRGGEDGELRMVKHKSRQLVHPGLEVASVL